MKRSKVSQKISKLNPLLCDINEYYTRHRFDHLRNRMEYKEFKTFCDSNRVRKNDAVYYDEKKGLEVRRGGYRGLCEPIDSRGVQSRYKTFIKKYGDKIMFSKNDLLKYCQENQIFKCDALIVTQKHKKRVFLEDLTIKRRMEDFRNEV